MGIIVAFLTLGLTLSLTSPLMTGSDQIAHFEFIRFIAKNGRLPLNWEERDEAGKLIRKYFKRGDMTFNAEKCKEIRAHINKHKNNLDKLQTKLDE